MNHHVKIAERIHVWNFVGEAYFTGVVGDNRIEVYGYIDQGKQWIAFRLDGKESYQTFDENFKSLRYKC